MDTQDIGASGKRPTYSIQGARRNLENICFEKFQESRSSSRAVVSKQPKIIFYNTRQNTANNMKTKIGFTGTQHGMSEEQKTALAKTLVFLNGEFHHGSCIGADEEAHEIVRRFVDIRIIIHPPKNESKMAKVTGDESRIAKDYLERNHDIVNETERLIACPKSETEELRSGTWATVRYAIKMKKPVTIIYPSGLIQFR